jgi:hypothetical protein
MFFFPKSITQWCLRKSDFDTVLFPLYLRHRQTLETTVSLIPSSPALSKLLSEYNHSDDMKIYTSTHTMRVGVLFPWIIAFVAAYTQTLGVVTFKTSFGPAVLGTSLALFALLGAYFTGCAYIRMRAPRWTKAFLYWVELEEKNLSDGECLRLLPALKRARELGRSYDCFYGIQASANERLIRRGLAEERRVNILYLKSELARYTESARTLALQYLKEADASKEVQDFEESAQAMLSSLQEHR